MRAVLSSEVEQGFLASRDYRSIPLDNEREGYQVLDSAMLAERWCVPETWIRDYTRSRAPDPIPHVRLGRYIRFEWGSPDLVKWWTRRRKQSRQ